MEPSSPGARAGALAAGTLELACRDLTANRGDERRALYLESVEGLSRDLGRELAALSEETRASPSGAALVSAALRAADLATLAACTVPELPPESPARLRAAAAAHLAAAAARSLALERRALGPPGDYEERDLRGAEWRAGLSVRQVEEQQEGA